MTQDTEAATEVARIQAAARALAQAFGTYLESPMPARWAELSRLDAEYRTALVEVLYNAPAPDAAGDACVWLSEFVAGLRRVAADETTELDRSRLEVVAEVDRHEEQIAELERRVGELVDWKPTEEELPDTTRAVLVALRGPGRMRRVARYDEAAELDPQADVDGAEYDDERDCYVCPPGWHIFTTDDFDGADVASWYAGGPGENVSHWTEIPPHPSGVTISDPSERLPSILRKQAE